MNRQEGIQEIDIEELDSQANTYTIKCMTFTAFAFFIVWLLNTLDVFIVDKTVMTIVFLATSAVMLLPRRHLLVYRHAEKLGQIYDHAGGWHRHYHHWQYSDLSCCAAVCSAAVLCSAV